MDTFLPNSRGFCFCHWYCSSCCGCCVWWSAYYFYGICIRSSCMDHYIQPCYSADPSPNLPSADYTAKLTWVRMRSSLHTLPCFCSKLSLMTGPGGYTWIGLLVSSVCSAFWKSIFENKALWKVVTNQHCSGRPIVQVHFHKWTLLKHNLLWG